MAVRVIQRGILPEEYYTIFKCKNCSSLIEAQKKDGKRNNGDGFPADNIIRIVCPVCMAFNHLAEDLFKPKQDEGRGRPIDNDAPLNS